MMNTREMAIRGARYTALVALIRARETPALHDNEREQLLGVADALLFGDPDVEQDYIEALNLIERLQQTERWSTERCDELRDHLSGCAGLDRLITVAPDG